MARSRTPVPPKNCTNFVFCGMTLSSRSVFAKCINCRNADKRYKERGIKWCLDAAKGANLRILRLTPYCGAKIAEIPKLPRAPAKKEVVA